MPILSLHPDHEAKRIAEQTREILRHAGVDRVIVPNQMAGMQLSHLILRPRVSEFIAAAVGEGEYDFDEIDVQDHPAMVGKSLNELDLPQRAGVIVFAIITGDGTEEFNPSGERKLREDDTLLIVSHGTGRERLHEVVEGLL